MSERDVKMDLQPQACRVIVILLCFHRTMEPSSAIPGYEWRAQKVSVLTYELCT